MMKVNIFNWQILLKTCPEPTFKTSKLVEELRKEFADQNIPKVNIIFVSSVDMKRLNREYRNKNSVTDVLSFNLDEEGILGEIYICPAYVAKNIKKELFGEEMIRLIVHGFLHLLGYDHKTKLSSKTQNKEKMFVKQEEIVQNVLGKIN